MRWLGCLCLGLLLVAVTADAASKKKGRVGALARVATPARPAHLAEFAKDATPVEEGGRRRPGTGNETEQAKATTRSARIPIRLNAVR